MEWPFVSRKKYNDLVIFSSRQQAAMKNLEEKVKSQDDRNNFTHNLYLIYRNLFNEASRRRNTDGTFAKRVDIKIVGKP